MSTTSLTSATAAADPPHSTTPPDADLPVIGRRHPWRWVGVAVVLVLLAMFAHGLITNPGWDWPTFFQFFTTRTIFSALAVTLQLTLYGTVLGFALGAVIASMRLAGSPFGATSGQVTSGENLFIGLDSAKYDVGFSNITVTEKRKQKYDFATYRKDDIAFEAKKGSGWKVAEGKDIAGKTIAVSSGTNQEKLLVDWNEANVKAGLPAATIKYFQNQSDTYLALSSGRIDAYLGPNHSIAYHVRTSGQTEAIGKFSGAGPKLQGLIAATTKKDNGLVKAYQAALNAVIADGSYAKVLDRWNVAGEAVAKSELNPPGLPITS